eukprot:5502381-Amphidinium_carterae.1
MTLRHRGFIPPMKAKKHNNISGSTWSLPFRQHCETCEKQTGNPSTVQLGEFYLLVNHLRSKGEWRCTPAVVLNGREITLWYKALETQCQFKQKRKAR